MIVPLHFRASQTEIGKSPGGTSPLSGAWPEYKKNENTSNNDNGKSNGNYYIILG